MSEHKKLSSRHNREATHTNSAAVVKTCTSTQYKLNPDKISAWRGEVDRKLPPLTPEAIGNQHLLAMRTVALRTQIKHSPVEGHTSVNVWVAGNGMDGCQGKENTNLQTCVGRKEAWILKELGEGMNVIIV